MDPTQLSDALKTFPLTSEVEDYLLSRGVKPETIRAEGIVTGKRLSAPNPDPEFARICGPSGEYLEGMLICPVRSPRGNLLGFEARSIHEKKIIDFRFPAAKWTPFFVGVRRAMPAIWAGGDIWIVEGLFDLAPLEWVVSPKDAVLATVRAHLSKAHIDFLQRFCKSWVHIAYDRDATGRKATQGWTDETGKHRVGALELLKRVGVKCNEVAYLGGKDPGEIWDRGGLAALKAAFPTP